MDWAGAPAAASSLVDREELADILNASDDSDLSDDDDGAEPPPPPLKPVTRHERRSPMATRAATRSSSLFGSEQDFAQVSQSSRGLFGDMGADNIVNANSTDLPAVRDELARADIGVSRRADPRVDGGGADKVKVPAGPPEFRLVAVDLFEVESPQFNVCSHPLNRVAQARARGASRWSFVIALHIPGPPFYTFVHYFTPADPDIFQTDTPFVRTSRAFFFGDDDTLRDHTFKLIPKCVDANWVVKRAVGGTPAILGKKLKQTYYRREHYFELDIDIGSDAIAAGVVRLALGYARSIVVDIGYVLEGKTEAQLPESIMGAVRIKNIDMAAAVKLPPAPTTP